MQKLTRKGAETRQRIVAGAAAEIQEHGVTGMTLEDVVLRTRTSKGQLFHYFPGGRDELLHAVAEVEAARQPVSSGLTSWAAWHTWRDSIVKHYRDDAGRRCTLSDLAAQGSRTSPGARAVIARLLATRQADLADGIRHLQAAGDADPALDADRAAAALIAGIHGGVAVLTATGSADHLEAALDMGLATMAVR